MMMVVMMVPSAVGSAAASSIGVIGGNRQLPGSRELMPILMISAHRPAVPDVRANGLSSAAMPWEDSARNEMAAHTALKSDVPWTWSTPSRRVVCGLAPRTTTSILEGGVAACDPEA